MSACERCGGVKQSGRGKRYCSECSGIAAITRKSDSRRRIRRWEQENPERSKEAKRRYNSSAKGRDLINTARRAKRRTNPREAWSTTLRERFQITADQYESLLAEQGGCCFLCKRPAEEQSRRLHVDHDHRCCPDVGRSCGHCIRGLLCYGCNRMIGWYESRRSEIDEYVDQVRSFA